MKLQLLDLVLWPRNPAFGPRTVAFAEGKVNVITGASKTGKSAVIPIIDYCLASDRCSIPVATIRDTCAWFGIRVKTSNGEMLLARREPGTQQNTGEMFVLEGANLAVPRQIDGKNTTVDAMKRTLDRLAGLSNLDFEPGELGGGFKGRPSFRDMVSFNFQPQNIVANPDILFFKADTLEHREKLRTIFPYVLGAISPERMAKLWELDQLQRELKRKERELLAQTQATERWKADLRAWAAEARDLGLATPEAVDDATTEKALIALLEEVVTKSAGDANITDATIDSAAREAAEIEKEESNVTVELAEVRTRFEEMTRLRSSVDEYTGALKKQRERLDLARWLRDLSSRDNKCPICGGALEAAQAELQALCDALAEIEASARQLNPVPAAFDRELVETRKVVHRFTDRLQGVRLRKRSLEERSARIRDVRGQTAAVDRFLGRAEQALKMFRAPEADDSLRADVDSLKAAIEALKSALSESDAQSRLKSALKRVSGYMSQILPNLDNERPNDPVELSTEDLGLRVTGPSGRADYLWEIGSGANWLSYHVAAVLALHQVFGEQSASPVPGFLVLDQPSQVYFPRKVAKDDSEGYDPKWEDEDVAAVRKVFGALGDAVKRSHGAFQVLVLDHAGPDVWQGLDEVHLVDEWRGSALVPKEWLPR
jgi:hypothetical protein